MDEKLLEILEEMAKNHNKMNDLLEKIYQEQKEKEDYSSIVDSLELLKKLGISSRTRSRWKKDGDLVPGSIGGRDFYLRSDVLEAIKRGKNGRDLNGVGEEDEELED